VTFPKVTWYYFLVDLLPKKSSTSDHGSYDIDMVATTSGLGRAWSK